MNITDELLIDYMLGEAGAEDRAKVDEWLQDAANRKYYEQFVTLWHASKLPVADVPVEAALAKVHAQLPEYSKRSKAINLRAFKIAAAVLLLAGGVAAVYLQQQQVGVQPIVAIDASENTVIASGPTDSQARNTVSDTKQVSSNAVAQAAQATDINTIVEQGTIAKHSRQKTLLSDCGNPNQYACNKTSCPIEICITQKSTCKDGKPTETSYCSVIRPDESGGICYRPHEERIPHCGTIVEQITITRIGTGETIVLDDNSRIKAQDLFNHITGEDCGSMIAGAFTKDCSNNTDEEELTINNSGGQLHFW